MILYDKEGKYLQSIPLKIAGTNIKIVADDRILVYETGFEEYVVHEINLSGEILQRALKTAKAGCQPDRSSAVRLTEARLFA
ncbi:MAG: hypothetical protein LBK96_01390 [Prevotellaceae bacterium]|nr:hypothetical protein [Prevotellaceae bacterium]